MKFTRDRSSVSSVTTFGWKPTVGSTCEIHALPGRQHTGDEQWSPIGASCLSSAKRFVFMVTCNESMSSKTCGHSQAGIVRTRVSYFEVHHIGTSHQHWLHDFPGSFWGYCRTKKQCHYNVDTLLIIPLRNCDKIPPVVQGTKHHACPCRMSLLSSCFGLATNSIYLNIIAS